MTDLPPYDPAFDEPDPDAAPAPARRALAAVPDRIPLTDLDTEAALLGACLQHGATIAITSLEAAGPDVFASPANALVAAAITTIHGDGDPIDAGTVTSWLRTTGTLDLAGGPHRLIELLAHAPSPASAPRHAATLTNLAQLRRLQNAGAEITAAASRPGTTATQALTAAQDHLDKLHAQATTGTHVATLDELLDDYLDQLEQRAEHGATGIATGWHSLDQLCGGLRPGTLTTIAARPGMGKTDLAAALALNAATAGHPVLFCSLEMSHDELLHRWVAARTGIAATDLQKGELAPKQWERVGPAVAELSALPVTVDDQAANTLAGIRTATTRTGAQLVIIDYLQLVDGPTAESRQQQVAQIAGGLKRLARQVEIPVVALAQLNRKVEDRADKRPMLSDLRESGAIEQDSDLVIGLYRDEIYTGTDSKDPGVMEALVVKNRHGATGCARLAYDPAHKRFAALVDKKDHR